MHEAFPDGDDTRSTTGDSSSTKETPPDTLNASHQPDAPRRSPIERHLAKKQLRDQAAKNIVDTVTLDDNPVIAFIKLSKPEATSQFYRSHYIDNLQQVIIVGFKTDDKSVHRQVEKILPAVARSGVQSFAYDEKLSDKEKSSGVAYAMLKLIPGGHQGAFKALSALAEHNYITPQQMKKAVTTLKIANAPAVEPGGNYI